MDNATAQADMALSATPTTKTVVTEGRLRTRRLLSDALRITASSSGEIEFDADMLAERLEQCLFCASGASGDVNADYRTKARAYSYNIGHNAQLRKSLLTGDVTPDELVRMSAADMVSTAERTAREHQRRDLAASLALAEAADKQAVSAVVVVVVVVVHAHSPTARALRLRTTSSVASASNAAAPTTSCRHAAPTNP